MKDRIEIRGLLVRTIVGIHEHERKDRQDVVIHVLAETDVRAGAKSDSLRDVPNYEAIARRIVAHVESSTCSLIERIATEVCGIVLEDARVERVQVTVEKPSALRYAKSVAVTIERSREDLKP
jgi:dihydroneopterin aldolase/D-erythro-7,8-dihydroneopterin triphosphate epimerase